MSKRSIFFLLFSFTAIVVNASGLDDFSNNLASDLGPLLSLLGEAATIQYLSESTGFIDYFIFAMAPIGIISTVTAVIRLCGNSTLRAFIGKAQEGESTVEAELCTSTSADVCEVFDKGGITRVLGRPDIMEIVYIPIEVAAEPRFHLFTEYLKNNEGNTRWSEIPRRNRTAQTDGAKSDSKSWDFAPKPNISLNVGIKRRPTMILYIVAAFGFILQSGVILFAGIGPWLLDWDAQKLSSEASRDYAPGIFIAGTVTLCLGIWSCAVLIGQASDERSYERNNDPSRIYWLQPGRQVVGDQTFHSFIYSDERKPLKIWTSSIKMPQKTYAVTYIAVSLVILGYIAQFIGLRGLNAWISIAQLAITLIMSILRGILRMQRLNKDDNLIQSPFGYDKDLSEWDKWVAGHELDWLAVEASEKRVSKKKISKKWIFKKWIFKKDMSEEETSEEEISTEKISTEKASTRSASKQNDQKGYTWHITGQHENATIGKNEHNTNLLFCNRMRLSHLTGHYSVNEMKPDGFQSWEDERVKVRLNAKSLGAAISQAAATLLRDSTIKETINLKIKVMVENTVRPTSAEEVDPSGPKEAALTQLLETIFIKMKPPNGLDHVNWTTDSSQLEAALGLWYWSMSSKKETNDKSISSLIAKCNKKMFKIVSACYKNQKWDESIEADMNLWQGSTHLKYDKLTLRINKKNKYSVADFWLLFGDQNGDATKYRRVDESSITDANTLQKLHKICGWNVVYDLLQQDDAFEKNHINVQGFWINPNEYSLLDICVQELYAALLHSMKSLKFRDIRTDTMSICETRWNLQIEDSVITALANFFRDKGLGTHSDAISCVMPLLRSQLHSYHDDLLPMLIQAATGYRLNAEWKRAERVLRWACDYEYETRPQENKNMAQQELGELYRRSFESEARDFGKNGIKWMVSEFKGNEISKRYEDIAKKISEDNDIYRWPASRFSEAISKGNRVDALSHLCFTKPGDFNSDKLGKCLPLAAHNGWSEVVTTLLEMRVKPDMQDEGGRTAASYFAELGQQRSLQQLIDNGADLDMADHTELTPLMYAIKKKRKNIVKQLLNTTRVDCNKRMTNGRNALWFAVEQNSALEQKSATEQDSIDIMVELLGNGDGINQEDYRVSPLFLAAKKGHKNAVEQLIKRGAAVDKEDKSQATPLLWAMWRGHAAIAELLVKALEKTEKTKFIQGQINEAKTLLGCNRQIEGIRNRSDGYCSTWDVRPDSTIKSIDQQLIDFKPPYSDAPRIILGISSMKMEWRSSCRVQWEASKITESKLELTRTESNGSNSNGPKNSNLVVKSSSVVWLEFDSHEDDFQGTEQLTAG
jgi:ankyrin repeat protein